MPTTQSRRRPRLACRFVAAAGVLALACSTAQAADGAKGKKVVLLESLAAVPYVATVAKSFMAEAKVRGFDATQLAAGLDAALQARQMDDAIARKYDLIAVAPISEQGIVPALARAKQAGIPVVLVNNPAKAGSENYYLTFVGQDQNEMGKKAGELMLDALKAGGRDGGKVALITGALSEGIGPRRLDGIKSVLSTKKNVQIVAVEDGHWQTAPSERIAGQLYARFAAGGGLDLIYGMADNQAVAAIKAAKSANVPVGIGPKKLAVVGGNCMKEGIDAIKAGTLYGTLSQIPTDVGKLSADTIADYFEGKKLPKQVLLPVEKITKANVDKWAGPCTY